MIKKDFEDLVFYQNRYSRRNKKDFRNFIFEKAGELGMKSEIYPRSKVSKNVVVGDIKKAKYIIATFYDTPINLPASVLQKGPVASYLLAFLNLIIALMLIIFIPKMFYLAIPFILLFLYTLGVFGMSKRFNFNTTTGMLCILDLMRTINTKNNNVAYVFLDNHFKGYWGAKAMAKQMAKDKIDRTEKKIIVIDRIGLGNNLVLDYFRETKFVDEVKEAIMQSKNIKAKIILRDASLTNTSDHYGFRKFHHVALFMYTSRNAKGYYNKKETYKNDREITLENVSYVSNGLFKFLEKNVQLESSNE